MFWWMALLMQFPQTMEMPAADKNPHVTPADVAAGKKIFGGRCAGCHGPAGDGGKGANLAAPVLPRASSDRALFRIIRYGIPDTEMPSSLLSFTEVWQLAAFVRSLGKLQEHALNGDARRGEEVVRGKGGCLQCHALGLEGGRLGPAVTSIGSRRGPGYLREKVLDPANNVPDQFRMVQLTTKQGASYRGVRLNEDTWSIQVRDMSGNPQSFWKDDLAELKEERRTPMPSYRSRLSDAEANDVAVYLSGLRGGQ